LRWDALGEFLALAVSLDHYGKKNDNAQALTLSKTLDAATDKFLENQNSPSRKVGELDNRDSHLYLRRYSAEGLAALNDDGRWRKQVEPIVKELNDNETKIVEELNAAQGKAVDIEGYYWPNEERVYNEMRPSKTLNAIIENL